MFLSKALAAAPTGGTAAAGTSSFYAIVMQLLPFILIFVVFYFLLIRPQKKKQQEHKKLIENIKTGDKVILTTGIVGEVVKIKSDSDRIIIKTHETEIEVIRSFISAVIK